MNVEKSNNMLAVHHSVILFHSNITFMETNK